MKKINVTVQGLSVYANGGTYRLKIGSRGPATPAPEVYRSLPKGEARRLRKALRAAGCSAMASMSRA